MSLPSPLSQIPPEIASAEDYESYAKERLPASTWAYFSGGSGDEITLRRNRDAFESLRLIPRVLASLQGGHTRVQLLGSTLDHPILLAPVAYQRLAHPDGELATALGASALRAAMVLSTQSSTLLEEVAAVAQAPLWFQLYIQPDREFTLALVRRAEAAGYRALVVTVDAPVNGLRNREQRARFQLPPGIEAVNLRGMRSPPLPAARPEAATVYFGPHLDTAPTWHDLAWLRENTRLPVLVKGLMHPDDASLALDHGAAGIIDRKSVV